ncbi:MAG TPA: FtsX-like permease family protein [Tepidiformaceae bacterium]|nr:FtsX-like permease family protein [Tepidiformaceae bacterium]
MDELFGVSMTVIAGVCVVITALILLVVAILAWRNPVMFKNGLRNIPRRKSQTTLIVIGLMLSTVIITAAFGTGDTLTHSITNEAYTVFGPVDEFVTWDVKNHPAPDNKQVIPLDQATKWEQQLQQTTSVKAIVPFLGTTMPVLDTRTRLNDAKSFVVASPADSLDKIGGLKDVDGKPVTLGAGEIALNKALVDKLDAKIGDKVQVFYHGQASDVTVKAIVPNTIFGGTDDTQNPEGAALNFDFMSNITNKHGVVDILAISNDGSVRGGLSRTDEVSAAMDNILKGTTFKTLKVKQDTVHTAQLVGNVFTTLFVTIGLFAIAAGILLIFLIFVMLAAERKPEMGMARAVGAKRRQIVESFLAEGMGYDLGSAMVGLVFGVGVAALMVYFVKLSIGGSLGLNLQFTVAARSLITAFCIGVITTFIVVFLASWRASRINIVAAIRDLPESHKINPEDATWRGYLRGTLNGFVAFGVAIFSIFAAIHFTRLAPIFILAAISGIAGPWLAMLRNSNFGAPADQRKEGDHLPRWPWIVGLITAVIGIGIVILVGYFLALLVVRLTRERRPRALPTGLILLGIVIAPLGLVLAALQDRGRQVAWSVGLGTVGLAVGVLMIQWAYDAERSWLFFMGVSLILLWAAITLRYFRIQERLSFTVSSALLLLVWYLGGGGQLHWLTGDMKGGVEMFFLSGLTMVVAGTFIVVYNADIILPVIGRFGARFGRIFPAVKTAIAYPLTSRFRTGLTIGMIGLIMFVLSMEAALNTNISKSFATKDALGGYNVRVQYSDNNLSTNGIRSDLTTANAKLPTTQRVDTSKILAVGETKTVAGDQMTIRNPKATNQDWKHYILTGADADFIKTNQIPLQYRAAGYDSDQAVWQAVGSGKDLAIVPSALVGGGNGFGGSVSDPLSLPKSYTKDGFEPFQLEVRGSDGQITRITVIGETKDSAASFWPGIIVSQQNLLSAFPSAQGQEFFLRLAPGTNADRYAKNIEATLVATSADSLQKIIDDGQAISRAFLNLFEGFLALGLIVGIAALGVIAFRAVVERRQQIGMLRAIGYQRNMVMASFLMESGFIAISGILLGLILGLTFAWSLFHSGNIGSDTSGIAYTVPWAQVGAVTAFALVASLLMTWLPARAASKVPIAEALRYE